MNNILNRYHRKPAEKEIRVLFLPGSIGTFVKASEFWSPEENKLLSLFLRKLKTTKDKSDIKNIKSILVCFQMKIFKETENTNNVHCKYYAKT